MEQQAEARGCTGHGSRSRCSELLHNEHCMHLSIQSTTGTRFELSLPAEETVEGLKKRLSQKLRVSKDRLALLHKDTRLSSGRLQDFGVTDGSKLTLVPSVEAGLMSQVSKPEQSIMQALESLTETQVGDFLSGRSPLTLALRVGDHMMFVQLQLAAQNSSAQQCTARGSSSTARTNMMPCGGSNQHPHPPYTSTTAHNNQKAEAGDHTHHTHRTQHSQLSPTSSPTQSVNHPQLAADACSPAPRAATPFQQSECGTSSESGSSSSWPSRKSGAVIESFVNHAPGVFSGTFSGTLHPNCQDSSGRPRRDITTILQILNDLLSATRHYPGTPPALAQLRCHTQTPVSSPAKPPASPCPPPSPTVMELPSAPVSQLSSSPTSERPALGYSRIGKPAGEPSRQTENRLTRCKLERLQLLLQQRRLRRRARREPRAPYHWLSERKATRSHSNSSLSSNGSIDLDYDEALWKNDVQADMGTEFVVA
ncbi:Midnolin [Bagarius yarrelli]|uniref:Midnolin n=1 Tax=Bagarius yarrelli TaxID=175774 RepID=A0A556UG75_BAGYA|nr:Midnolin [Bagarius yarrelli]